MTRQARRDGLILFNPDGRCIMVRGESLPEALERAREWAGEEGYELTDPLSVHLEWIRAVPCPPHEHGHDDWRCPQRRGSVYLVGRPGPGAFRGIFADLADMEVAGP